MKISPVFCSTNFQKTNSSGQRFLSSHVSNNNFKPHQEDMFIRLAAASLKDKKIEHELGSMGLI